MKNKGLYYQPSGIAPLKGILLVLVVGIPTAAILGVIYSWCIWKIPFIYLNVALTGGLAIGLGILLQKLIRLGKIRNTAVSLCIGFIIALVALYAKWSEWSLLVDAEFIKAGITGLESNLLTTFLNPLITIEKMIVLNKNSLWLLHGIELNGILLWVVWSIEAGIIFFLILACVFRQVKSPFSESGNSWIKGVRSPALTLAKDPFKELRQQLEQGNFTLLLDGIRTTRHERNLAITFFGDDSFGEYYFDVIEQKAIQKGNKINNEAIMLYTDAKSTRALRVSKTNYEKLRTALGAGSIAAATFPAA